MRVLFFILKILLFSIIIEKSSAKIEIQYKINNEIITNIDIENEKNYLIFLKPSLKSLPENEILKIAENSLIKEIIKNKELKRIFKDNNDLNFTNEIKKNLFKFKNVSNETEFKKLIKKNNINYKKILKKIEKEAMWNELIFQKYSPFVKINKEKLRKELIYKTSKNKKYEYNLSEILFEINANESFDGKYSQIIDYIKNNNFKVASAKFSISNSSNKGGEIGWVKETLLSKNLNSILAKMKINETSDPIKYPNGYLILKINNKREMKQVINIEKELKDLINFEKNRQLSQFSVLLFKKLKQNVIINEY